MHRWFSLPLLVTIPLLCPAGESSADRGPLQLTLKRAVELALSPEGNTYIQLSDENLRQAKSRSAEVRSALLPDIETQASETTAMRSLAALGLDLAASDTLLGAAKNPPSCTATPFYAVFSTPPKPPCWRISPIRSRAWWAPSTRWTSAPA